MIQAFVDRFMAHREGLAEGLRHTPPEHYTDLVRRVVTIISGGDDYESLPDPERIHQIDDGDYQGTLVYVIGETGYQPSTYWYVRIGYGSCSGCDTFQEIQDYRSGPLTPQQVEDYMTLMLHIVQGLKQMGEVEDGD